MTNKDQIKDLFSHGLQDHQVSVDPALWSSISSSLGAGAAKTGLSILTKTLIGVAASSIAVVSIYLATQTPSSSKPDKKTVQQKTPAPKNERIDGIVINPTISLPSAPTPIEAAQNDQGNDQMNIDQPATNNVSAQTQIPESVFDQIQEILPANSPSFQISGYPKPSAQVSEGSTSSNPQSAPTPTLQPAQNLQRISLPNIFTPNSDGQNEYLQIDWQQAEVLDFSIVVLDAKNNIVYRNDNPHFQWDGTDLGGEKTARGTYIYFVTALLNGQKWQQSSSLQIQY
jgi:gliding motility-associated-like protein